MNHLKPFMTFEQQLKILEEKYGLIIDDRDFAKSVIINCSYYDIVNGYQNIHMIDGKYKDDITMEYLYDFYKFDRNLQQIFFYYSTAVEIKFKNIFSYVLAKNIGDHYTEYLSPSNYVKSNNKFERKKLINTISKIKSTFIPKETEDRKKLSLHKIDEPTKHYVDEDYNLPPWILFKNITFSNISILYTFLKKEEKDEIANMMISEKISVNDKKELLKSSIDIVRRFRNYIAHDLNFLDKKISNVKLNYSILSKTKKYPVFVKDLENKYTTPYTFMISLLVILDNSQIQEDFIRKIMNEVMQLKEKHKIFNEYMKHINGHKAFFYDIEVFLKTVHFF